MSATEDQITEWFARQRKLRPSDFPIGIGDDMAQVRLDCGGSVLVTTDMLLDGVHFDLKEADLEQVGYKAMAAGLSDCAAMATIPLAAVVSVALPAYFGEKELKRLHAGITSAGDKFNCALVGGDITSWHSDAPFAITVTMLSRTAGGPPVKRSGARVGDTICVTGSLGAAPVRKHLHFEPRVTEAIRLAQMVTLHSMIDLSDGLSSDLNRICRQSSVGALIEAGQIPISEEARKSHDPVTCALNDGEDFELLFTLADTDCRNLLQRWNQPLSITKIGTITAADKVQIRMADGRVSDLKPAGYDHLR